MTKIIELAHMLGEEIAKSNEIKELEAAKAAFDSDEELQEMMREYETERILLTEEFSKDENSIDQIAIANLKARIDELGAKISKSHKYIVFTLAQNALNDLMASVNAEIKFCITGERPASCTHDCSTCGGCSH